MALVTDGILTQRLPWGLVLIGVFLTIAIELMGLQSLPIAVGVYLPISTSAPMFIGGAVRWLVERRRGRAVDRRGGVRARRALASGLIAGGAIAGVTIAAVAAAMVKRAEAAQVPAAEYLAHLVGLQGAVGGFATSNLAALVMFTLLGALLYRVARR